MLIVVATCLSLGQWQWHKAERKQALQNLLEHRGADPLIHLPRELVDGNSLRFRHVGVRGRYDAAHQILIDNRVQGERPGYHVVTPLKIEGSELHVLVNRGWVPAVDDRRHLPELPPPAGLQDLSAIAVLPGKRFFTLAPEAPQGSWQTMWQNLDLERYRQAVSFPLQPVILQLDPSSPGGYVRDWPRPDERIERHVGYALQWAGFALAAVGIWLFVNFKRT